MAVGIGQGRDSKTVELPVNSGAVLTSVVEGEKVSSNDIVETVFLEDPVDPVRPVELEVGTDHRVVSELVLESVMVELHIEEAPEVLPLFFEGTPGMDVVAELAGDVEVSGPELVSPGNTREDKTVCDTEPESVKVRVAGPPDRCGVLAALLIVSVTKPLLPEVVIQVGTAD